MTSKATECRTKRLRADDRLREENEQMEDMVSLLREKAEALMRERDQLFARQRGSGADATSASGCSWSAAPSVGSNLEGRLFQAADPARDGCAAWRGTTREAASTKIRSTSSSTE